MYKATICDGRNQVCKFLENMTKLGYNPKMQVMGITEDRGIFTIFYEYFEDLGEPKSFL